jgi:hypothetical protein
MAGIVTAGMIGAGLSAVGGIAQMASGIFGKKKRQREIDAMIAQRPKYEIPKEVGEDLAMRRNLVNAQVDGQQELVDSINTDKANALNRVQSSSGSLEDMLAVGVGADAQSQESLIKANDRIGAVKAQRRNDFSQSLSNLSSFRDQAFKLNELDPYNMKTEMTMANNKASREMTFGGLNQAAAGMTSLQTAGNAAGFEGGFFKNG